MALGVDGMKTSRVIVKVVLLTLGTLVFVVCLTMVYKSMRSVMDIGGSCASGNTPYEISRPCPKGVGWMMTVGIFGMFIGTGISLLGVFPQGGPRPYVFGWSALCLSLGWNFLDYGFDAPNGGTSAGWLVCGFVFVAMGGVPLVFLLTPKALRWELWGPNTQRADDYLHPYKPPPVRSKSTPTAAPTPAPSPSPTPTRAATSSTPYARTTVASPIPVPEPAPAPPEPAPPSAHAAGPGGDVVEQLATLADLRERGMLDDAEYEKAKAAVLRTETPS
jgi:hypothetical protein